ncbi:unnamed protein product [Zymoseptoria tritici ST99CH_3D7]|uniref:Uncharacterized protein n=1 Tax=Zymoseptoria tritici (strain ST99CH_3D7) TaxID=1276538 RepID=A0A1X7RXR1_ZYMT9|nr:unnamed protein product [Zymoseptoria tritici ST99CH_3D7]
MTVSGMPRDVEPLTIEIKGLHLRDGYWRAGKLSKGVLYSLICDAQLHERTRPLSHLMKSQASYHADTETASQRAKTPCHKASDRRAATIVILQLAKRKPFVQCDSWFRVFW